MKTFIARKESFWYLFAHTFLFLNLGMLNVLHAQILSPSALAPPVDVMQETGGLSNYQLKLLDNGDVVVYGEAATSIRTHTLTTHFLSNGTGWIEFDVITGDGQTVETCRIHDVPGFTSNNIRGIDYVDPASIDLSNYSIVNTTTESKSDKDLLVARLDRSGQSLWTQTIGSAGFDSWGPVNPGSRATLSSDGHIVLAFAQTATDGEHYRLALSKVNLSNGSILWSRLGPLNEHMRDDFITDLVELADGSLMATGSAIKHGGSSGYAMHFDASGNYLAGSILNGGGSSFIGHCLLLNPNQELLFQGESVTAGVRRTKITQLNASATSVMWNRQLELFDPAKSSYRISSAPMILHPSGGYLGFGHFEGGQENHALLYHIDQTGNIIWSREYDFSATTEHNSFRVGRILPNGHLLLGGTLGNQSLLTEINLADGSVIWAKTFGEIYKHIPTFMAQRSSDEILLANLINSGGGLRFYAFNEAGEAHGSHSCKILDITADVQYSSNVMISKALSSSLSADLGYNISSLSMSGISTPKGLTAVPGCGSMGFSCDQEALIWANPTQTKNFVHNQTFRVPVKDDVEISALSLMREKHEAISYFDGLGRPVQTSVVGLSPSLKDIIQPISYDAYGRQSIQYLPYTSSAAPGEFFQSIGSQIGFYMNLYPNQPAYAETAFEPSPLNRVIEQSAPGTDWQMAQGHTMKTEYLLYGSSDIPSELTVPYLPLDAEIWEDIDKDYQYKKAETDKPESDLLVRVSTDENGHQSYLFTDKMGKTIMQSVEVGPDPNNSSLMQFASTYYIYDSFNRVKYVIQPQGFEDLLDFESLHKDLMQSYAFWYEYDERGRVIMKKVPGSAPIHTVYDQLDRVILTQDGNQANNDLWTFSKYDILGRPIITGEFSYASNGQDRETVRDHLQATVDAFTGPLFESRSGLASSNTHGYTDLAFPSINGNKILSVSYYDDYSFDPSASYQYESKIPDNQANLNIKGITTGVKVRVLHDDPSDPNETNFLTTITFYDDRGREIQTQAQNLFGWDVSSKQVNFAGEVERTVLRHQGPNGSALSLIEDYCHDHRGEIINISHESPDAIRTGVVSFESDELGRNTVKQLHSIDDGQSSLQAVDFSYNIRNWLTHINKASTSLPGEVDLFSMNLRYQEGFTELDPDAVELYNGNISGWTWQIAGQELTGYAYTYDHSDRLLTGKYAQQDPNSTLAPWIDLLNEDHYSLEEVRYDRNGNIQRLRRRGPIDVDSNGDFVFGMMDDLTYDFFDGWNGNQVTAISDFHPDLPNVPQFVDGHEAAQPEADWDYYYDANGNMVEDRNKGITVHYNHFNKPDLITFDTGETISYLYDAAGSKLRKTVIGQGNTSITDYLGAFHYTDQSLEFYTRSEGRVLPDGNGGYAHQYHLMDHLGNTRVSFGDLDKDGSIDLATELVQADNYYPFGLGITGDGAVATAPVNQYLYNGKELQREFGLGWYDYGARMYDASIGRWNGVDVKADKHHPLTPYDYVGESPINRIDPNGEDWILRFQSFENNTYKVSIIFRGAIINSSNKEVNMQEFLNIAKKQIQDRFTNGNGIAEFEVTAELRAIKEIEELKPDEHLIEILNPNASKNAFKEKQHPMYDSWRRNYLGKWEKKRSAPAAANAAIGGKHIYINSNYIDRILSGNAENLIAHEVGHSAGLIHRETYSSTLNEWLFPNLYGRNMLLERDLMTSGDWINRNNKYNMHITPRKASLPQLWIIRNNLLKSNGIEINSEKKYYNDLFHHKAYFFGRHPY